MIWLLLKKLKKIVYTEEDNELSKEETNNLLKNNICNKLPEKQSLKFLINNIIN